MPERKLLSICWRAPADWDVPGGHWWGGIWELHQQLLHQRYQWVDQESWLILSSILAADSGTNSGLGIPALFYCKSLSSPQLQEQGKTNHSSSPGEDEEVKKQHVPSLWPPTPSPNISQKFLEPSLLSHGHVLEGVCGRTQATTNNPTGSSLRTVDLLWEWLVLCMLPSWSILTYGHPGQFNRNWQEVRKPVVTMMPQGTRKWSNILKKQMIC